MKLKVKDYPGLVRDPESKAIINVDQSAYLKYKSERNIQNKITSITSEINDLKQSMNEIKNLISQILQRTN